MTFSDKIGDDYRSSVFQGCKIVSSLTNHPTTSAELAVALRTTLCSTQHSTMT
jgi:hypothetical protein